MSWSTSTLVIPKAEAIRAINTIEIPQYVEAPALEQIRAAQEAAKELLKYVPGPRVRISMSGHANGVGWQKKDGYADDCITVTVTQITEEMQP